MKFSLSIKIVITVSVVLLCVGAAFFSFVRLHSVEQRYDFDLYALVPRDAIAVFETNRAVDLFESIEQMQCSEDGYYLHVSDLFDSSKDFLNVLLEEAPHALSKRMNKMLISFHMPDTSLDQVLYVALGAGERKLIEEFLDRCSVIPFPVKRSDYLGKEIRVYSLRDGRFLAVCLTDEFLAVSFQKKLLEKVLCSYKSQENLLRDSSFRDLCKEKQGNLSTTLYLRTQIVPLGQLSDTLQAAMKWGDWMELELEMDKEAIYGVGICHETDSLRAGHGPYLQKKLSNLVGGMLPASTALCTAWSVSDSIGMKSPISPLSFSLEIPDYAMCQDSALIDLLNECGAGHIVSCVFYPNELLEKSVCAVAVIPLSDEKRAQSLLSHWLQSALPRKTVVPIPRFKPMYDCYPHSLSFRKYLLPPATLFFQLTGLEGVSFYSYACFYRGNLLLAADAQSLSAYIEAVENENTLNTTDNYKDLTGTLTPLSQYLLMADIDAVAQMPPSYSRQLPTFFLKHIDFFRHFLLAVQFTRQNEFLIPNITLLYRPVSASLLSGKD